MTTPIRSKPIIILEGPDGAGKTTLAKDLADRFEARYAHLGPMTSVKDLGRIYVEAMLPAIQGYQTVVMDRAWYSEEPYGAVFREGKLRNDSVMDAMLERIVLACTGVVIHCETDSKRLVESFTSRKGDEYLERADQMLAVARHYKDRMARSALPVFKYDYAQHDVDKLVAAVSFAMEAQGKPHKVEWQSAGSANAEILLVGDCFTDHQAGDPLLQRPFVSFTRNGSSYWITRQLQQAGIPEHQACWINQDSGLKNIASLVCEMGHLKKIICLGKEALATINSTASFVHGLVELGIVVHVIPHPQHHRRFKHHEPYPLIDIYFDGE